MKRMREQLVVLLMAIFFVVILFCVALVFYFSQRSKAWSVQETAIPYMVERRETQSQEEVKRLAEALSRRGFTPLCGGDPVDEFFMDK